MSIPKPWVCERHSIRQWRACPGGAGLAPGDEGPSGAGGHVGGEDVVGVAVEVLAGPYWRSRVLELSEYPARESESSYRNPLPPSMRSKRTLRSLQPSGGRIQHQKGSFQRHA